MTKCLKQDITFASNLFHLKLRTQFNLVETYLSIENQIVILFICLRFSFQI